MFWNLSVYEVQAYREIFLSSSYSWFMEINFLQTQSATLM